MSLICSSATLPTYSATADYSNKYDGLDAILSPLACQTNDLTADWRSADDGSALDAPLAPTEEVSWWINTDGATTLDDMTDVDGWRYVTIGLTLPLDGPSANAAVNGAQSANARLQNVRTANGDTYASAPKNEMSPQLMSDGRWKVRTSARTADGSKVQSKRLTVHGWHARNVGRASIGNVAPWLTTSAALTYDTRSHESASLACVPNGSGTSFAPNGADGSTIGLPTVNIGAPLTRNGKRDGRRGVKSDRGQTRRSQRKTAARKTAATVRTESPQTIGRTVSADVVADARKMLASESIG